MKRTDASSVIQTYGELVPPLPSIISAHTAAFTLATDLEMQY
jgi:hypothetical protein